MDDIQDSEVGIYKRIFLKKKERKHAVDHEKKVRFKKKERKYDFDREKSNIQEKGRKQAFDQENIK